MNPRDSVLGTGWENRHVSKLHEHILFRLRCAVVGPRPNCVDHSVTDQISMVRFIEDHWLNEERMQLSFDASAGPVSGMFDFDHRNGQAARLSILRQALFRIIKIAGK